MPLNKKLLRAILVRKIRKKLKRKPREMSIRSLFFNRIEQGESILVRELREDPHYHHRYFRMRRETFDELLNKVQATLVKRRTHSRPISPMEKLAITLRYLASGNSQVSLALSYRISPASICNILRDTMRVICNVLESTELPTPSKETWLAAERNFSSSWNFPNCCGAIDGKHIRIRAPSLSGSVNYNYKGYFSIALLAIVDANYRFMAVDIGATGSQSDGGILSRSLIGKALESKKLELPSPKSVNGEVLPHVIVGDDAFPLRENLMKPFPGRLLTRERRIYNYRLSRARMVSENAFGILAARWRILHTFITADPDLIKLIVMTCVILHNFLINKGDMDNLNVDKLRDEGVVPGSFNGGSDSNLFSINVQGSNNHAVNASLIREGFMKYFTNEGRVIWQDDVI